MKKILIILIMLPVLSFGQKFEVSEMIGYSAFFYTSNSYNTKSGPANQLSFSYYPIKKLSISAIYGIDIWSAMANSFGLAVDYSGNHIYFGATASMLDISSFRVSSAEVINYKASLVYGARLGFRQKLSKKFYLKEQVDCNFTTLKGTGASKYNSIFTTNIPDDHPIFAHILIGLGYRF